jgi:hypothetical protein
LARGEGVVNGGTGRWLTFFRRVKFGQMDTRLRAPEMRFRAAQRISKQIQIKRVGGKTFGEGESV